MLESSIQRSLSETALPFLSDACDNRSIQPEKDALYRRRHDFSLHRHPGRAIHLVTATGHKRRSTSLPPLALSYPLARITSSSTAAARDQDLEPTRCSRNLPSFIHDLRSFFENNPEINRTIYKRQAATALAIVAHMTKVSLCNFVGANLAQAIEGVIKNNTLLRNYLRISAPYFLTGVGVVNAAGYLYDKKNHKTTQQNISGRTLSLLLTVAVTGVLIFESTKDDPLIDSLIAEIFGQVFGYHIPRDLALDQFILTKDNSDKRYPSAAVASSGAYGLSKGGIQVIVQALAALNVSAEQVDAISSVLSGMVDGGCSIFKGRLNYYQDRGTCKGWRMSATLQRPSRQSLARALLTRLPAHVIRSLAPAIIWYVIDQQCLGNLSAEERQRWHDVLHDGLICLLYMISQLSYDLTNS